MSDSIEPKEESMEKMRPGGVSLFLILVPIIMVSAAQRVPLHGMFETSVTNDTEYDNKFRDVDLEVIFTAPNGDDTYFWGFFDGDGYGGPDRMDVANSWEPNTGGEISGNIWKMRFMPTSVGTWEYWWRFTDDSKTGQGSFECIDSADLPGVVTTDGVENPRYARNARGPFFFKPSGMWTFVGPTYDTSECSELYERYIAKGFNCLMQQGTLPVWPRGRFASTHPDNNGGVNDPHITIWYQKKNFDQAGEDGPTMSYAETVFDTDRMNLFTWKRVDQHLSYLAARKIYFLGWQGFNVKRTWPIKPGEFEREKYDWYTRYAMARLAPYYNIIWNNTWESSSGAEWLRENMTEKGYDPWGRIFLQVDGDRDIYDVMCDDRDWHEVPHTSDRPVWSLESNGLWWVSGLNPQELAYRRELKFLLNASVGLPVEQKDYSWTKHLTHKGMDYIAMAYQLVEDNFEYWHSDVAPSQHLVSEGVPYGEAKTFCLARPGYQYMIYHEGDGEFTLDMSDASGTFTVTLFDPETGRSKNGDGITAGGVVTLNTDGAYTLLLVDADKQTGSKSLSPRQKRHSSTKAGAVRMYDLRGRRITVAPEPNAASSKESSVGVYYVVRENGDNLCRKTMK